MLERKKMIVLIIFSIFLISSITLFYDINSSQKTEKSIKTSNTEFSESQYKEGFIDIPEGEIYIFNPNHTSSWKAGNTYEIRWNSTGNIEKVRIVLLKGNEVELGIIYCTENDGYYAWTIPTQNIYIDGGNDYRVRIGILYNEYYEVGCFFSEYFHVDPYIYVPPTYVNVFGPNEDSSLIMGTTYNIAWSATGWTFIYSIDLYKNGFFERQIKDLIISERSYIWTIPTDLEEGHYYQIKVTASGVSPTGYGYSKYFGIYSSETIILPTSTGYNVIVEDPISNFQISFDEVSDGGTTVILKSNIEPDPPSGFQIAGDYYDIRTTSTYSGNIQIAVPYDESNIIGSEDDVRLFHWDSGSGWTDITTSINTESNIVYGITNSFSIFAIIIPGDITPPIIVLNYIEGDWTDNNPGKFNFFAYDDESGINQGSIKIYLDDSLIGNNFGDYNIPNNIGEHILYIEVENNNFNNPLKAIYSDSFIINDDDSNAPEISYYYTGDSTDANPGEIIINVWDASGLIMDPSGSYAIPNEPGIYAYTFTATDADNDRPGDSLSETIDVNIEIIDDDSTPPEIANINILHDIHYISVIFDAIDISGIGDIQIYINGELIEPFSQTLINDTYSIILSNQWILKNDVYDVEISLSDADNDRPNDSLTSTISGTFDITLEDMYEYVDWQIEELKTYVDENLHWLISFLIRHKLDLAQKHLAKAYELIECDKILCALFHDAVAQILVEMTEFKIEIFNRLSFINDDVAEFMLNSIQNIRNNIILLIGASAGIEQAYEIALLEIELFNLNNLIENEIDWCHRVCLSNLISGAAANLESAIFMLTLNLDNTFTLNLALYKLELAEDKIYCLRNRGKITQELADQLINRIDQIKSDIEYIKNS